MKSAHKIPGLATSGRHNFAMITNAENSRLNGPHTGCLVSIFTIIINSKSSFGAVRCVPKGTYPNFWQSLTVTVDVLLGHDAKVNKAMWAWQLCDVASVNK